MQEYPIDKLVADFDETVSEEDTISLLVHAAADSRNDDKSQFLAAWQEMVEWYFTRYNRVCNEWLVRRPMAPRHALQDTQYAMLTDFLASFRELELASIQRVVEQGFLAGVTSERSRAIGRSVVKKPGVDRVLSAIRAAGGEVEILSANWSAALIEGAMEGLCNQVIANRLEYDATGRSTGNIHLGVVSAQDKLKHLRERNYVSVKRKRTGQTLYIGDSISDFLAILNADLGVLIGSNPTAMQTIERFNLSAQQLREGTRFNPTQQYQGAILLIDSWEMLEGFLSTA
jgi:HAD superfamily phosphoserine phosphatase-like hydrolase